MTKKEWSDKYKREKIELCSGCGNGPRCFMSHFDSRLIPIPIPDKVECSLRKEI